MIIPKHYENLNMLHENTMPYRSYYVPASACMGALVHDREKSDRIEFLNGNWKFRFYESIYDLQEKFYEESYDTNGFGEIPVPGIWQNFGYDEHQYTNVRYPIAEFLLTNAGAEIIRTSNGKEAVEAFAKSGVGEVNVILMDIMMPVMDGLAATREIRTMNRSDASAVVIIARGGISIGQ